MLTAMARRQLKLNNLLQKSRITCYTLYNQIHQLTVPLIQKEQNENKNLAARMACSTNSSSSSMINTKYLITSSSSCTALWQQRRLYSSETLVDATSIDSVTYDRVCTETLDALCDYFEELTENANLNGCDVSYSDGVLTVNLGNDNGTYVINRQSPNKQIWLSSPTTGPKRYDFVGPITGEHGKWVYKHSGESLHSLLQVEIPKILKQQQVNFLQLPYCS